MYFRKDINGLRAWAVVAVVLFHFGVPGFEGGFVGVDVFFVISGFLMTGIIVEGLSASSSGHQAPPARSFSLGQFYLARARRILPALLALCAVLIGAGWLLLGPSDYEMLATHGIRVVAFISNLMFLREAGYFDAASHEKWFLHTWSLSVEWQFYLLFPLILMLVWKIRPQRKVLGAALWVLFFSSLGASIIQTPLDSTSAFFQLHTRAWEMLAGGLVYFYGSRVRLTQRSSRLLELAGFFMIVASIALMNDEVLWPGHWALLPITGTVLVMLASRQSSWLSTTGLCQWLGKTSYSIYLWHWPLCVGLVYFELQDQWIPVVIALALTLVLGWLSWAYIEQPARKNLTKLKPGQQTLIIVGLVVVIALVCQVIRKQDGIHGRLEPRVNAVFAEADNVNPRRRECYNWNRSLEERCTYGGDTLGVIVMGDSHAQSMVRSVEKALPSTDLHVLDWSATGCVTIANIKYRDKTRESQCGDYVAKAVRYAETLPGDAPMLIVNRITAALRGHTEGKTPSQPPIYLTKPHTAWTEDYYAEVDQGFIDTVCAFAAHRPVYMLRPIPELKLDVPRTMGRALIRGEERRISISLEEYEERHKPIWNLLNRVVEQCGVKLLDPRPILCPDGRCWGDVEGLPIYYDDDHLNERGGQLLVPLFQQIFAEPVN